MSPSLRMAGMKADLAAIVMALVLVAGGCLGCTPKFRAEGSLTIGGVAFSPVVCHVLAPRVAGIEMVDAAGNRMELLLPHAVLAASERISGIPEVTYGVREGAGTKLGSCGTLSLDLGGAHGAASGVVRLDCGAKGDLSFTGCL
jgi:hypothetical protein